MRDTQTAKKRASNQIEPKLSVENGTILTNNLENGQSEVELNVKKIIGVTNVSEAVACAALYDNNNDLTAAIESIMHSNTASEWKSVTKKQNNKILHIESEANQERKRERSTDEQKLKKNLKRDQSGSKRVNNNAPPRLRKSHKDDEEINTEELTNDRAMARRSERGRSAGRGRGGGPNKGSRRPRFNSDSASFYVGTFDAKNLGSGPNQSVPDTEPVAVNDQFEQWDEWDSVDDWRGKEFTPTEPPVEDAKMEDPAIASAGPLVSSTDDLIIDEKPSSGNVLMQLLGQQSMADQEFSNQDPDLISRLNDMSISHTLTQPQTIQTRPVDQPRGFTGPLDFGIRPIRTSDPRSLRTRQPLPSTSTSVEMPGRNTFSDSASESKFRKLQFGFDTVDPLYKSSQSSTESRVPIHQDYSSFGSQAYHSPLKNAQLLTSQASYQSNPSNRHDSDLSASKSDSTQQTFARNSVANKNADFSVSAAFSSGFVSPPSSSTLLTSPAAMPASGGSQGKSSTYPPSANTYPSNAQINAFTKQQQSQQQPQQNSRGRLPPNLHENSSSAVKSGSSIVSGMNMQGGQLLMLNHPTVYTNYSNDPRQIHEVAHLQTSVASHHSTSSRDTMAPNLIQPSNAEMNKFSRTLDSSSPAVTQFQQTFPPPTLQTMNIPPGFANFPQTYFNHQAAAMGLYHNPGNAVYSINSMLNSQQPSKQVQSGVTQFPQNFNSLEDLPSSSFGKYQEMPQSNKANMNVLKNKSNYLPGGNSSEYSSASMYSKQAYEKPSFGSTPPPHFNQVPYQMMVSGVMPHLVMNQGQVDNRPKLAASNQSKSFQQFQWQS